MVPNCLVQMLLDISWESIFSLGNLKYLRKLRLEYFFMFLYLNKNLKENKSWEIEHFFGTIIPWWWRTKLLPRVLIIPRSIDRIWESFVPFISLFHGFHFTPSSLISMFHHYHKYWKGDVISKARPGNETMRPDCVSACIEHVTYMERKMDE